MRVNVARNLGVADYILTNDLPSLKVDVCHKSPFPITPTNRPLLDLASFFMLPLHTPPAVNYTKFEVGMVAMRQIGFAPNMGDYGNHLFPRQLPPVNFAGIELAAIGEDILLPPLPVDIVQRNRFIRQYPPP